MDVNRSLTLLRLCPELRGYRPGSRLDRAMQMLCAADYILDLFSADDPEMAQILDGIADRRNVYRSYIRSVAESN